MATSFAVKNIACVNEAKAGVPILTGIGYLDHMIDQWNSHAQVGVGLEVVDTLGAVPKKQKLDTDDEHADRNQFAGSNQVELCKAVGEALGAELKAVIAATKDTSPTSSRFCCPLDEALVECLIASSSDGVTKFQLAPYGIYPRNVGRTQIGKLQTVAIESFWRALATSAGISISLDKIRGDNAHHIGRYFLYSEKEGMKIQFLLAWECDNFLLTGCNFLLQWRALSRLFLEPCVSFWIHPEFGTPKAPTTW